MSVGRMRKRFLELKGERLVVVGVGVGVVVVVVVVAERQSGVSDEIFLF